MEKDLLRRKSADGKIMCFDKGKPFYLSRVLPGANKKNDSLASFLPAGRQVRLCGENPNLEKIVLSMKMAVQGFQRGIWGVISLEPH